MHRATGAASLDYPQPRIDVITSTVLALVLHSVAVPPLPVDSLRPVTLAVQEGDPCQELQEAKSDAEAKVMDAESHYESTKNARDVQLQRHQEFLDKAEEAEDAYYLKLQNASEICQQHGHGSEQCIQATNAAVEAKVEWLDKVDKANQEGAVLDFFNSSLAQADHDLAQAEAELADINSQIAQNCP